MGRTKLLRTAVHLDAAGRPDGYVAYRPGARQDGHRRIKVVDLVALSPTAHLRLWRLLADVDLSDSVEWDHAAVDDPLAWALVDPYRVRVTRHDDALWVRLLDVPAALEARPWAATARWSSASTTRWVMRPDGSACPPRAGGRGQPHRGGRGPHLDADALGALYLGGVGVRTAARRRSAVRDPEAVGTWAAMADTGPAPHCLTGF